VDRRDRGALSGRRQAVVSAAARADRAAGGFLLHAPSGSTRFDRRVCVVAAPLRSRARHLNARTSGGRHRTKAVADDGTFKENRPLRPRLPIASGSLRQYEVRKRQDLGVRRACHPSPNFEARLDTPRESRESASTRRGSRNERCDRSAVDQERRGATTQRNYRHRHADVFNGVATMRETDGGSEIPDTTVRWRPGIPR